MGVAFVVRSRAGEVIPGELAFSFEQTRVVLGRGAAADVRIPHPTVSEHHATVQARGDHYVLVDSGSTNGTKLDGQRLTPDAPKKLRDGALIDLGVYTLQFRTGVLVNEAVSAERTAELARRLLRDAADSQGARIAAPRLCIVSGTGTGTTLELPKPPARVLVGSAEGCQLVLADAGVAREHIEVVVDLEGVLARNLDPSFAATFAGQHVMSRRLRDGDELIVGSTHLLFEEPAQAPLDALKGVPDALVPAPPPAPEQTEVLPSPLPASPTSAGASVRKADGIDADLMIYALAAVVLVASALGLVFLLHAH